jgi:hypothetical protein
MQRTLADMLRSQYSAVSTRRSVLGGQYSAVSTRRSVLGGQYSVGLGSFTRDAYVTPAVRLRDARDADVTPFPKRVTVRTDRERVAVDR